MVPVISWRPGSFGTRLAPAVGRATSPTTLSSIRQNSGAKAARATVAPCRTGCFHKME